MNKERDPFNGKPWPFDDVYAAAARLLWQKYNEANGSSERAFVFVIGALLSANAAQDAEESLADRCSIEGMIASERKRVTQPEGERICEKCGVRINPHRCGDSHDF